MDQSDMLKVFKYADAQNNGYLSKEELKIAMLCIFGFKLSKVETSYLLEKYGRTLDDKDARYIDIGKTVINKESLSLNNKYNNVECSDSGTSELVVYKDEFIDLVNARMAHYDIDDEIREIFQCIDVKRKGFIDMEDFTKAVRLKMKHIDGVRIERLFKEVDTDLDGRVSYRDFQLMMKYI